MHRPFKCLVPPLSYAVKSSPSGLSPPIFFLITNAGKVFIRGDYPFHISSCEDWFPPFPLGRTILILFAPPSIWPIPRMPCLLTYSPMWCFFIPPIQPLWFVLPTPKNQPFVVRGKIVVVPIRISHLTGPSLPPNIVSLWTPHLNISHLLLEKLLCFFFHSKNSFPPPPPFHIITVLPLYIMLLPPIHFGAFHYLTLGINLTLL